MGGCKTRQTLKSFVVVSFVDGSTDLVDHFGGKNRWEYRLGGSFWRKKLITDL